MFEGLNSSIGSASAFKSQHQEFDFPHPHSEILISLR
jgi:hypothetical protein